MKRIRIIRKGLGVVKRGRESMEKKKDNVVVVKEEGKVFWFCGSCGRPLAKTKGTTLVCPRGHVKTGKEYVREIAVQKFIQMEFAFRERKKGVKS